MIKNKSIIILDEPTASLDSRNKQNMIKNIKKICVGKTLIVITHDNIGNDFSNRGISFDGGFLCNNGQHPRLLRLLIQKKLSLQTAIVLDHFLSFSKNWTKEITEKVVWPKISSTLARLKPFMRFNETECKLIMKEIFVND